MILSSSVGLNEYCSNREKLYNTLNKTLFESLYHYTSTGYKTINTSVSQGTHNKHSDNIQTIFKNHSTTLYTPLYRGEPVKTHATKGDTITFPHYISTSVDPHQAYEFTNRGEGTLYIITPKQKGLPVSYDKKEMEILLNSGSVFTVVETFKQEKFYLQYPETDYGINYILDACVLQEI